MNLGPLFDERDRALIDARIRSLRRRSDRYRTPVGLAAAAALMTTMALGGVSPARIAGFGATIVLALAIEMIASRLGRDELHVLKTVPALLAVSLTGGVRSPLFPAMTFACAPYLIIFSVGSRRARAAWWGAGGIALLTVLPEAIVGPPMRAPYDSLITGISIVAALVAVGTTIRQLRLAETWAAEEIRRLRGDLLHEAVERSRTFEAVAAKVGHELKTPIAAMRVLIDIEHRRATDPASAQRLARTLAEMRRLSDIVNDYLLLAKPIEALEIAEYDLETVVHDVIAVVDPPARRAGVEVHADTMPLLARGDRRRIREALLNLVSNAVEASTAGGSVTVALDLRGDHVHLEVRDRGTGIPASVLPKVGTAFFTTREGGTGLGLVLARTVVVQHGGRLSVDSEEGRGTTVTVSMPRRATAREVSDAGPR